jgi:xylulokinase
VLAVDLGTGGPKVGAVALDGELLATSFTAVPTERTDDGGVEQDVGLWWDGIRAGVRRFVADGVVDGSDLHAVGLTSQWSSTVAVDGDGEPVGRCLMWSDHRGADHAVVAVGGRVAGLNPMVAATAIRYSGTVPLTTGEDPLGHELFLRHGRPEHYARTRALLEPVDYLGLRFTGVVAATPASQFFASVVDNRAGRRPRYVPSLVARLGRDASLLPPLRPTGSVLGSVLPAVAAELGVRPGAPVVCGAPDFFAAYLGSGAVGWYQGHLAVSTTSWLTCRVPRKRVDPVRMMASVPGVEPGSYLIINDQASAGSCLRWWIDRQAEVTDSVGAPPPDYATVLQAAAEVPRGSDGVVFLPWLRGEHTPVDDRLARGGFVNVSAAHGVPAMTRALLEGVALNGRWLLEAVEAFARRPLPSLRILGGGAQSDLWCQIYADVLGRPVERVSDPMFAQLRGAAMLALVGLGETTVAEAAERVPVDGRFVPEPGSADVYDPLFAEMTGIFGSLRKHHHRLNG